MDRRKFLSVAAGGVGTLALSGGCRGKGNVLKIVSSLPRTGSAQGQTDTIVNGIKMAIEEYGHEIAGMKLQHQDMDDATAVKGSWTAELETANAQKAAADPDVMVYIGPYNSGAAKISMPILNEAGLLQVSPSATWPGLTKTVEGGNPDEPDVYRPAKKITFCRVCTTDEVQGPLSAKFAKGKGMKSVFVINDSELYGKGVASLFIRQARAENMTVLGDEAIDLQQQEFEALLTRAKNAKPDLVYFGGTSQTKGGQIAKDMVKVGLACPLMVPDGCYEKAFIESAGAANLNGRCYATIVGTDPSQLKGAGAEFVKHYEAKFGKRPEAFAAYGYECAKVALEAIKKVGKKDRAAILEACLDTTKVNKGVIGEWSFDKNGDTTLKQLTISKIENGEFVPQTTITA